MSSLKAEEARIYLQVPFKEKDDANKLGAKWDNVEKSWFTLGNNPNNPLLIEKWSNKPVAPKANVKQIQTPVTEPDNSPRIYINVPKEEKDDAKALGAKWDSKEVSWYTTQDNPQNIKLFTQWSIQMEEIPKPQSQEVKQSTQELDNARIYINVPKEEKDNAKALGAKWDSKEISWYTTQDNPQNKELFAKWGQKIEEVPKIQAHEIKQAFQKNDSPRIYLDVSRAEKDDAKALGAKWDSKEVSWYTTQDNPQNKELFARWESSEKGEASKQFEKLKDIFENTNSLQELLKSKDKTEVIEALKAITETITPAPKAEVTEKTSSRMKM